MRKLSMLFMAVSIAAIAFTSCKKKEVKPDTNGDGQPQGIVVEEKNTSVIHKFTGTNCYYCGDWGWPMFTDIINEHHGIDAVCIGSYSQNQFAALMIHPFATAMDKRLPVTKGYPTFASNFYDAWTGTNTLQGMKDNVNNKVNEHKAAPVVVNSGLTYKVEGDNIIVNTRTKFFKDATGEYNVSVIILEDGVIANQAGPNGGPNASHHLVLRASNGDWGNTILSGSATAGATFDKEITIAKSPSWNMDKVQVAILIWKKNGTKWDFVNAHLHKK